MKRRVAVLAVCALLGGCDRKPAEPPPQATPSPTETIPTPKPTPTPTAIPTSTPTPKVTPTPEGTPTPLPQVYIPYRKLEVARLFNGIRLNTEVTTRQGEEASKVRVEPGNYAIDLKVSVTVPKPAETMAQLELLNPGLGKMFPGLAEMVGTGKVSAFYHGLFDMKVKEIQRNIARLETLISHHNFYDCETILELKHPTTGRKVLLLQGEMDVDADGSDADRLIDVDGTSLTYQPFTSYKWPKKTDIPNQFLVGRQTKLKKDEAEFSQKGLGIDRNRELRQSIDTLKKEVGELEKYSFLISKTDPFVVLPGFMLQRRDMEYTPKVGDYAAVIYGDKVLPAIFGDVGPHTKIGEASLRICKELQPKSDQYNRPVSDLKVTYLVFPGTAETPFGPPDLPKWHAKVKELINEMGGTTVEPLAWVDLIPKPTPSVTPTPTPSPTASPTPSTTP